MVISLVIGTLASFIVYKIALNHTATYTKILNGEVVNKERVRVSCEHSYQICTGSGESRSCTTHYRHSHDYDWWVRTNVGDVKIDRVNDRGDRMPPRFNQVVIGEPAAIPHRYLNFAKSAQHSLYQPVPMDNSIDRNKLPQYPRVFDYYRANRVLSIEYNLSNRNEWNDMLLETLKNVGPRYKLNTILVFVSAERFPERFAEQLRSHWEGAEHNDVIIIIAKDQQEQVQWTRVMSDTVHSIFNVSLSDDINRSGTLSPIDFQRLFVNNVKEHFKLTPIENYDYLKNEVQLSTFTKTVSSIIIIVLTLLLSKFFSTRHTEIPFFSTRMHKRRTYRR